MLSRRTCVCSQCGEEGHNRRNRQCPVNVQERQEAFAREEGNAELRRHALEAHTEASRLTIALRGVISQWETREIGTRRFIQEVPSIIHWVCFYATVIVQQGISIDSFFPNFKEYVITVNRIIHRYGRGRIRFSIQENTENGEINAIAIVSDVRVIVPRTIPVSDIKRTVTYLKEVALLENKTIAETEDVSCPLCFDDVSPQETVVTNCSHAYCLECIKGFTNSIKDKTIKPCCPMCRTEITQFKMRKPDIYHEISEHLLNL